MSRSIYIAGPMTGKPSYNYPAFIAAAKALSANGYTPIHTAHGDPPHPDKAHPHHVYIREALALLLTADAVALLPGWERSVGARLERDVALACGMPVAALDAWTQP